MKKSIINPSLLMVLFILSVSTALYAQNLLNTNTWTVGSGSVSGFSQNGATAENSREYGLNHAGQNVILWKASPGSTSDADGGWNSSYHSINHNTTYRFTVWIKKTNSNSGTTYLGCNSTNNILRLDGTVNNNPYFWYGDLPQLNRWYLIVGFVHRSSYTSDVNLGRIYDGVTGQAVKTITDYKFKSTATSVRHRSYLYYDTNTSDRQYFWGPRLEPVNGSEPSISQLLGINTPDTVLFSYDTAGNQTERFLCPDATCSVANSSVEDEVTGDDLTEDLPNEETDILDKALAFYPNPTNGRVSITLSGDVDAQIVNNIHVFNARGSIVKTVNLTSGSRQTDLDLTALPSGVYLIHLHLSDGQNITKKLIKN
jgi:hypothetical protein